jgi:hypothetical protein
VAECIAQMGYVVRLLTGADLTPAKLQGLDAVVIGVRAFNERTDLKDAFPGLLAWVDQGGTVIAQYNRPNGLLATTLGPYALSIDGPAPALRVTDETAPVVLCSRPTTRRSTRRTRSTPQTSTAGCRSAARISRASGTRNATPPSLA